MPRVVWVVLVWQDLDAARRCLASLFAQTVPVLPIVVDNGSDHDIGARLAAEFSGLRVIRLPSNRGVAAGRNVGIAAAREAGADFIGFLDDDAFAAPDATLALLDAAARWPAAGALAPMVYRADRPNTIWRAGCTSWRWCYVHALAPVLDRLFAAVGQDHRPAWLDHSRGANQLDVGQFMHEIRLPFQFGGAILVRRAALDAIGWLDEAFSPYGSEDIDAGLRMAALGWEVRFAPRAHLWHRIGSSFRDPYQRTFHNVRNTWLVIRRHGELPWVAALVLPEFVLVHVPLRLLDAVLQRSLAHARGLWDAIRWTVGDVLERGWRPPVVPPRPGEP